MYAADFKEDDILLTHKILEIAKPLGVTCNLIHDYYELISNRTIKENVSELKHEFENEDDVSIKNLNQERIYKGLKPMPERINLMFLSQIILNKISNTSVTEHFFKRQTFLC